MGFLFTSEFFVPRSGMPEDAIESCRSVGKGINFGGGGAAGDDGAGEIGPVGLGEVCLELDGVGAARDGAP